MDKKIKNRYILILGAGFTLKKYWNKIDNFIKDNNIVTIGCNNINHITTPDYHFWTDRRRYLKYGKYLDKKSVLIFGNHFDKKLIRKYWKRSYEIIKYTKQKWKKSYEDPKSKKYGLGEVTYDKKTNTFHGVFRTVGSLSILWANINKARIINIVGMDGYTLYSKDSLIDKKTSQHCYGKGFTDIVANANGTKKYKEFYKFCAQKDEDIYKTLISIKKYGVKFEIITPTVYKEFYNSKILNI